MWIFFQHNQIRLDILFQIQTNSVPEVFWKILLWKKSADGNKN